MDASRVKGRDALLPTVTGDISAQERQARHERIGREGTGHMRFAKEDLLGTVNDRNLF